MLEYFFLLPDQQSWPSEEIMFYWTLLWPLVMKTIENDLIITSISGVSRLTQTLVAAIVIQMIDFLNKH